MYYKVGYRPAFLLLKDLVLDNLPKDYQADLQASLQGSDSKNLDSKKDPVILRARATTQKSRSKMVARYLKNH